MASGSAAISRPSRPRLLTSRPTSAPFVVSYCRHVPDTGSYVFNTNVAVASWGFDCGGGDDVLDLSAGFAACFAAYFSRFFIFEAEGFRTVYLDVMRVYNRISTQIRINGSCSIHLLVWPSAAETTARTIRYWS